MSAGQRLVTVLVTVAVPEAADPEDAAALLADAASSSALEVVHAAGVEGHLPAPGALVLRSRGTQPWRVQVVAEGSAVLVNLVGETARVPLVVLTPDPLQAGCPQPAAGPEGPS